MSLTATTHPGARYTSWALQLIGAGGMLVLGALPKLTGSFPSPQMFQLIADETGIGLAEPMGRYAVGATELAAALLLLVPRTSVYGGILLTLAMAGAFMTHVGVIGMNPAFTPPDSGEVVTLPFYMSLVFLAIGVGVTLLRRDALPIAVKHSSQAE